MFHRNLFFVFTLFVCLAGAAYAQSLADTIIVPLTVNKGFPLEVILTEKVRFKENEPVHGKVIEPVYAFDREVVPSGAEVVGKITGFQKTGKWKSLFTKLGGDFTPVREPEITFDALVLPGGTMVPIDTFVAAATEKLVRFDGDKNQPAKDLTNALVSKVKEPGKERLKNFLWGLAPYRPQSLPVGTRLNAILLAPLDFGIAAFETGELGEIGSKPPAGSVVSARLVTSVDSRTSEPGTPVEAILSRPLFSSDHRLIFPVGSRLRGEVLDANAARKWHRHGELALEFTAIERPVSLMQGTLQAQRIEGHLASVQVAHDMDDVRISEKGGARISESKKRFIGPAYALVKAGRAIGDSADPFARALLGAYRSKLTKRIARNDPGLGLTGSITGAMIPPVGIGLGLFGAARSVYSNFLGRGQDIYFPADTSMEIRLD